MPKAARSLLSWFWPLLWVVFIFITSSTVVTVNQLSTGVSTVSGGRLCASSFSQAWLAVWWIFVKGWHAAEFAILFLLIRRVFQNRVAWAASLALGYAVFDELHQVFVSARGGRVTDMLIDALGVFAAWLIVDLLKLRRSPDASVSKFAKRLHRKPLWITFLAILWIALLNVLSLYPTGEIAFGEKAKQANRQFNL